ncbi:hypothetical protein LCL61_37040 [Amycolatopsis coloradensis]|uniref:Uncharacterized protein n=1 Tax=Amycolatopsis coloradensis TaxID=76021 RepID=A0ACD5BP17_9PSEU
MFVATGGYVRKVIHAFNESWFAGLPLMKWSDGRPRKFGSATREQMRTAACKTATVGLPFTLGRASAGKTATATRILTQPQFSKGKAHVGCWASRSPSL